MSTKTLLTNGTAGKFRNGLLFLVITTGKNKYIKSGLRIEPIENWDLKTFVFLKDDNIAFQTQFLPEEMDIVEIYKPLEDRIFVHAMTSTEQMYDFNFVEEEWTNIYTEKPKFSTEIESEKTDVDVPKITTKVWIEINGKPVDINNLTPQAKNILNQMFELNI